VGRGDGVAFLMRLHGSTSVAEAENGLIRDARRNGFLLLRTVQHLDGASRVTIARPDVPEPVRSCGNKAALDWVC